MDKTAIKSFLGYIRGEQVDNKRPVKSVPIEWLESYQWLLVHNYIRPVNKKGIYVYWHKNDDNPGQTIDSLKRLIF